MHENSSDGTLGGDSVGQPRRAEKALARTRTSHVVYILTKIEDGPVKCTIGNVTISLDSDLLTITVPTLPS